MDKYSKDFETSYFSEGIQKLEERWMKYVNVEEDYVKKWKRILHKKGILPLYFLPYL